MLRSIGDLVDSSGDGGLGATLVLLLATLLRHYVRDDS